MPLIYIFFAQAVRAAIGRGVVSVSLEVRRAASVRMFLQEQPARKGSRDGKIKP